MNDHRPIPIPDIDTNAIARFAEIVFGGLDGYVAIRLLAEKGTQDRAPHAFAVPVRDLLESLNKGAPDAARGSRAVYVVPATVSQTRTARAEDIASTAVVVVDLDTGDIEAKRAYLERHLGPASLVVASGGCTEDGAEKLHLYWRLAVPASGDDRERVRAVRERLARLVGGDTSFASLHQPIRVPGTIHGKNGRPTLVRVIDDRSVEYALDELETRLAGMPPLPGITFRQFSIDTRPTGPSARDLATRRIRAGGVDDVTRFQAMSKVIGHWVRQVRLGTCSAADAWTAVAEHNAAMMDPPWEERRLKREFDALRVRDFENHGPPKSAQEPGGPQTHFSDDALAALFIERFGADWRHVAIWGAWFNWTGLVWQRDETGFVREQVRQTCRAAALECDKPGEIRRINSDKTISAVVRIAASDPAIALRMSDLDRHPMLLNTPDGVIDLASGEVLPHDRDLHLTQITAASSGTECSLWRRFLDEITDGDLGLQAYLQRLAGYLLTGSTEEQIFAFFHGPGANGKSVFIDVLAGVLGDYAATATLDTFMASPTSRHLTELAGLRAARLVIVPETEQGRAWAEARIKTVTGGEKIRANFMHRDHFEFTPQFKLVVAGNHRPMLTGTGEAMRRRLHLVPFGVTIPPEKRDHRLAEKLRAELDGILGWMLEGCAEWHRIGLAPPEIVQDAARGYFEEEDLVGQWIEEVCETGPDCRATSQALFSSWSSWAEAGGHPKGTKKSLGETLRHKGFKDGKVMRTRGWIGLRPRGGTGETE